MKKIILVLMLVLLGVAVKAETINQVIEKLIQVESNGNVNAIGDKGKAKGCLQIWDCVLIDVNAISKKKYTKEDCFDKAKSKEICSIYLMHYGKKYQKRTGRVPDTEVLARIWNGGPNGYKKVATIKYWDKVKRLI